MTTLQKSSLIYQFTYKCDICYIGRTNQCLEIRINQHIPSNIQTHTSDYTTALNSYNSTSTLDHHLLANQTCACVYSHTMFTILETSINVMQLSSLEALLIKNTNQNCVSKSNLIFHCFLIIFSDHQKKTSLTVPTLFFIFSMCFSSPLLDFPLVTIPCLLLQAQNQLSLT